MADKNNDLLAFAGAEGFGAHADGGRGGKILKVTNLKDSGAGSLRWALEDQEGPRIVVFEVGGTIKLDDQIQINGDVTVAGQTAPGGVTITGGRLRVVESDVIIRGLHVRPGDEDGQQGGDRDGISVGKRGSTVEDVIIDSNSISWAVDETASAWGSPSDVTFSNNIFAEALRYSIHPEGRHSMGLLVGDGSSNVSVIDNLFAHNMFRNATVKDDAKQIEFVNNVIYNYGPNGFLGHEGVTAHIIGNVYIPGADSASRAAIRLQSPESGTAYYLDDNVAEVSGPAMSKISRGEVFKPSNVTVLPSGEVVDHVLSNAGARAPSLDAVDARIVASVRNGTGELIDSPRDVGGARTAAKTAALPDSDGDGIPDRYEAIIGSDPNRSDANADADRDGYDNIESYINGLLDGFRSAPARAPSPPEATEETPKVDPIRFDGDPVRYEVEDFDLTGGFTIETKNVASANNFTRSDGYGLQTASMTFDGPTGTYDIAVRYFDENDGESTLSVYVDRVKVDAWRWDEKLGGDAASDATKAVHVIEDVFITSGETFELVGKRQKNELLRLDAVDFIATGDSGTDKGEGEEAPRPEAPSTKPSTFESMLQAEDFQFVQGFRADKNPHASGGTVIRADGDGEQQAKTTFDGPSGIYDIAVHYFDENDGAAELTVKVGGKTVDNWDWDQDLGNRLASAETLTSRVIEDVRIDTGDTIILSGFANGDEPLRIDAVELFADMIFG